MWVQIIVSLVMMVVSAALTSAAQAKVSQTTPEAGKLDIPTAEEGGDIPVIFGTCIIKKSNVIWYGDSNTTPIKSDSGGKK